MSSVPFLELAEDLEIAGLLWHPEIGDEIADRTDRSTVSILVDPHGLTPKELRASYIWLPTVEQMVVQLEVRQAVLFHAGLELSNDSMGYKTVIRRADELIEAIAESMRLSIGMGLRKLLLLQCPKTIN